jgi:hypothetical protein
MDDNTDLKRLNESFNRELNKDLYLLNLEKEKFINQIKNGLGDKLSDYNTYIKRQPTFLTRIKNKIIKLFKYI